MEFIKLSKDRYMIKDSNNYVVSEEEKLQLEKKELVLKDVKGCECQQETPKKISKINKKLEENETIKEAKPTTE